MPSEEWIEHAYPLQQLTIKIQGTRHSNRSSLINQLKTVVARLESGEMAGQEHDDDFGHSFEYVQASPGPSFFAEPEE